MINRDEARWLTSRTALRMVGCGMIWVVGAVSVDMVAAREAFRDGTSNPCEISIRLGGVGYNIYRALEPPKLFISAIGTDLISSSAENALAADPGVVLRKIQDAGPSLYLALMQGGRLKVAASDMRAVENGLELDWVVSRIGRVSQADMLVLDGNLSSTLTHGLLERYGAAARVIFEPVSVEKAARHAGSISGCWLVAPTELEAAALAYGPAQADRSLADADLFGLIDRMSLGCIVLKRGTRGVSLYWHGRRLDFPAGTVVTAKDTTGAGDLLLALVLNEVRKGFDVADCVRRAMNEVERALQTGVL